MTAASMLAGLALPPAMPNPLLGAKSLPAGLRELHEKIRGRPAGQWVLQMYRRHRPIKPTIGLQDVSR
jgi:hypothetical protein